MAGSVRLVGMLIRSPRLNRVLKTRLHPYAAHRQVA
jgi:hypothetical protein